MILGLDLETTALDLATAKIVQLGLVLTSDDLTVLNQCSRFVDPGQPIPAEATAIHGITDGMVKDFPTLGTDPDGWWERMTGSLFPDFGECSALIGYNLRTYDIPLLTRECADIGMLFQPRPIIDVYDLVCWHYREFRNRKLAEVHQALVGQPLDQAHNATADVLGSLAVLKAMQSAGKVPTDLQALLVHSARVAVLLDAEWDRWEYYLYRRDGDIRIGFGKQCGQRLDAVDKGWLGWALTSLRDAPKSVKAVIGAEWDRRIKCG